MTDHAVNHQRSILQRAREWLIPPLPPEPDGAEVSPEQLRRAVRRIEIRARRLLRDQLAGQYAAAFRGRGLEFAELRPYAPGDEVRSIDWKATARLRQPVVRRYVEEREQTVLVLVDLSGSASYDASGPSVGNRSIEIAGVLGFAAATANDLVGAVAFSNQIDFTIPPGKGSQHVLRIVRDLLAQPVGGRTELARAFQHAGRLMRRRGIVIIISDFIAVHPDHVWEPSLSQLALRHDVVAVCVRDAEESRLPAAPLATWSGAERGDTLLADEATTALQRRLLREDRDEVAARLRRCGCDVIQLSTSDDYLPPLARLFYERRQRP